MRRQVAIGVFGVMVLLAALPVVTVHAQQQAQPGVRIETTPQTESERRATVVAPGLHYETTRPPDSGNYPYDVRVQHDPAFIEPFTMRIEGTSSSAQLGLSGWTSPNTPVGPSISGFREVSGWLGFGFSVVWNGPPAAKRPAPAKLPPAPVR
jgi:hypothetical protein